MKRSLRLAAIATLLFTNLVWAAANLNLSKSNINRVVYSAELASKAQINRLLAALDQLGQADEAKLKQWLPANFKRFGIDPAKVKKLVIVMPDKDQKETAVILLTNPADEAEARSTVKSGKSNSSE